MVRGRRSSTQAYQQKKNPQAQGRGVPGWHLNATAFDANVLDVTFALRFFTSELASTTNGLGLFAGALDGRLLEMLLELHFAEYAFTLKFFLQSPEGLFDVVVTYADLHWCHHLPKLELHDCAGERHILHYMTDVHCKRGIQMETTDAKDAVIDAALAHVAFDGWSEATLRAALTDSGVSPGFGRALFPRGAVDLALAYHWRGDRRMAERAANTPMAAMRYSERVATLIRFRLEDADKEAVRRGSTLFALPQHSADGARAIWHTSDTIWQALGDGSNDFNWYTKRATLSAVYAATVLFWLGDDSLDHQATWDFLDRRIAGVMKIEGMKAKYANTPFARVVALPFSWIKAPKGRSDMPGHVK